MQRLRLERRIKIKYHSINHNDEWDKKHGTRCGSDP